MLVLLTCVRLKGDRGWLNDWAWATRNGRGNGSDADDPVFLLAGRSWLLVLAAEHEREESHRTEKKKPEANDDVNNERGHERVLSPVVPEACIPLGSNLIAVYEHVYAIDVPTGHYLV
jgi:hypothetical protein